METRPEISKARRAKIRRKSKPVMNEYEGSLASSNHPIGPRQHLLWNRHADLFGSFEIDHQLKFRRLLNGEIRGLGSLEDFVYVDSYAPVALRRVRPRSEERRVGKECRSRWSPDD